MYSEEMDIYRQGEADNKGNRCTILSVYKAKLTIPLEGIITKADNWVKLLYRLW